MIALNLKVCNSTLLVLHLRHLVRVTTLVLVLLDLSLVLQRQSPSYLVRRRHCLDLKAMLQSLQLLQLRLDLVPSSRLYPSLKPLPSVRIHQILCLLLMVVSVSVQSRSKNPNSNLPLHGKRVADSLVTLVLQRQLVKKRLEAALSLFAILVSESNQNPSLHGFLLDLVLSSVMSPLPRQQHSYLRRRRHSSDSLALLQIFNSASLGRQSRLLTCWSEDHRRSLFCPSILVLVLCLFATLDSEIPQNPLLHSFQKDLENLVDLVVQQKQLVQTHQTTLLSLQLQVRSILLCSPSPSRSLFRQDSSQTRHSLPSNSELPRLVCNLSKFMANWTSPLLLLQKLEREDSMDSVVQQKQQSSIQSTRLLSSPSRAMLQLSLIHI